MSVDYVVLVLFHDDELEVWTEVPDHEAHNHRGHPRAFLQRVEESRCLPKNIEQPSNRQTIVRIKNAQCGQKLNGRQNTRHTHTGTSVSVASVSLPKHTRRRD